MASNEESKIDSKTMVQENLTIMKDEKKPKSILKGPGGSGPEVQERPCRVTRGNTKKVSWKPESTLVDIFYFENNPRERSNSAKGVFLP